MPVPYITLHKVLDVTTYYAGPFVYRGGYTCGNDSLFLICIYFATLSIKICTADYPMFFLCGHLFSSC